MNFLNNLKANLASAMSTPFICGSNMNDSELINCIAYTTTTNKLVLDSKRRRLNAPSNAQKLKRPAIENLRKNTDNLNKSRTSCKQDLSIQNKSFNSSILDKSAYRKSVRYAKVTCRPVTPTPASKINYQKNPKANKQPTKSNLMVSFIYAIY